MFVHGVHSKMQSQQLANLAKTSRSKIAAAFEEGALVALQGTFSTNGGDLSKEAIAFLTIWSELVNLPVDAVTLRTTAQRVNSFDSSIEIDFETALPAPAPFGAGLTVTFANPKTLRALHVWLPPTPKLPHTAKSPDVAIAALAARNEFVDPKALALGTPTPVAFESPTSDQRSVLMYQFERPSEDGPGTVLVSPDGEHILPIGTRPPGLPPRTPLPLYHLNDRTGAPDLVDFGPTGVLLPEATSGDPETVARAFFKRYPALFGTGNPDRQLRFRSVLRDTAGLGLGTTVVFAQQVAGVPIHGVELRVHLSTAFAVVTINGPFVRDPDVSPTPQLSAETCLETAIAAWRGSGRPPQVAPMPTAASATLSIVPMALITAGGVNALTWRYDFYDEAIFVSAQANGVVLRLPSTRPSLRVFDSQQRARQLTNNSGVVFEVDDYASGSILQLIDGAARVGEPDLDAEARRAHTMVDLFNTFCRACGRNGWNDDGGGCDVFVDVTFRNMRGSADPKLWPARIILESKMVSMDLVGHEATHLLNHGGQTGAKLEYIQETAAVDEGLAEVIGRLLFQTPTSSTVDSFKSLTPTGGTAPLLSYNQFDPDGSANANGYILMRALALLLSGEAGSGHAGIGRARTTRLVFETVAKRLTPWSQFRDVMYGAFFLARDLAIAGAQGFDWQPASQAGATIDRFDGREVQEIAWAFSRIDVTPRWTRGWFKLDVPNGQYTFYQGEQLPPGETVADVTVMVRKPQSQRLVGLVRASQPQRSDNAEGIVITMRSPTAIGTNRPGTTVSSQVDSYTQLEFAPSIAIRRPPNVPAPVERYGMTPIVVHFGGEVIGGRTGGKYRDVFYPGIDLPAGCIVTDVALRLVERVRVGTEWRYQLLPAPNDRAHRLGEPGLSGGGYGAYVTAASIGTPSLEVAINSWHDLGVARFYLEYWWRGPAAPDMLPEFHRAQATFRD
jgi:hypothetical protein